MSPNVTSMTGRLRAAWRALLGSVAAPSPEPEGPLPGELAQLRGRVLTLEHELEERDQQIGRLRREFDIERARAEAAIAGASREETEKLFRRLCPVLSQLDAMRAYRAQGKELRADDLLTLVQGLHKALEEAGLLPVGVAGEGSAFDPAVHQRMSGGDVRDGDPVRVRFVGYRLGETVLLKAMVSREA